MQVVRRAQVGNGAGFARHVGDAFLDQLSGLRMQFQRHIQRRRRALARMVVRRGADAAAGKHDIAACQGASQGGGDARRIVADAFRPAQLQAARLEKLDDLGKMLVNPFA